MNAPRQTDRAFGLMFAVIFAVIFTVAYFVFGHRMNWVIGAAGGFLGVGLIAPWLLMPLNRLWEKFAFRLGFLSNHLLLGLFYFTFVYPLGLMLRLFGSDPMHRKYDSKLDTYWTKVTRHANRETFGDMF